MLYHPTQEHGGNTLSGDTHTQREGSDKQTHRLAKTKTDSLGAPEEICHAVGGVEESRIHPVLGEALPQLPQGLRIAQLQAGLAEHPVPVP